MNSFRFLVAQEKIYLFGFVIMSNHIHFIWEVRENFIEKNVKQMFLKYSAQQIKFRLNENELMAYKSTQSDRLYQFWERRSWKAQMNTRFVLEQKLDYIHQNPVKAGMVESEKDYLYSSYTYYYHHENKWNFLTHYMDRI